MYTIHAVSSGVPTYNVCINDKILTCIADSGASVNVIPADVFPDVKWSPSETVLKSYGGNPLPLIGTNKFVVSHNGVKVTAIFYGLNLHGEKPLLSHELCMRLKLFQLSSN